MKAMILAAGEGTRLRPLTLTLPKPMVPVGNRPLLERTIELLARQGARAIAVNLFHKADVVLDALGDGAALGVSLRYSVETQLLGTAGGVRRQKAFLDETFAVLYGDNLYDFDLAPLVDFHRRHDALATLATFTPPDPTACGLVETDADGRVTRFREKPPADEVFTDQANAGVYVLEPEVLDLVPDRCIYDFGHDLFPRLLTDFPDRVFARPLGGLVRDTGTIANYRQANWDILTALGAGDALIHPDAHIHPEARLVGRNVIGAGCRIGAGAQLRETILWDGAYVGAGARIDGAVLGRGVHIGDGAQVEAGAVLADGARIALESHA